jgi:hypothetical protein
MPDDSFSLSHNSWRVPLGLEVALVVVEDGLGFVLAQKPLQINTVTVPSIIAQFEMANNIGEGCQIWTT